MTFSVLSASVWAKKRGDIYRITNAVSEGINNKIKVLKRRSYGFQDDHFFFLKILNATHALPLMQAFIHNF